MAKKKFYAVKVGVKAGIYESWVECQKQVDGVSGAKFKSFSNREEAEEYLSDSPKEEKEKREGFLECYTDGSSKFGNYGWAFVVYDGSETIHTDSGVGTNTEAAEMGNVAGELAAVMRAVLWSKKNGKKIVINYDYEGVEKWVTCEWMCRNQFTADYGKFMDKYTGIYSFNKVKGHSGNKGNDVADKLARSVLGIQ